MTSLKSNYTPVRASRSKFQNSRKKKQGRYNRASKPGSSADRLWRELSWPYDPYHYSLKHLHLGIDPKMAQSKYLYDYLAIKSWKDWVYELIKPPYFYKFEVGEEDENGNLGKLHVHLIADVDAGLLHIPRTGKVIKPVTDRDDFERRLIYLFKPGAYRSPKAVKEYIEALARIDDENKGLPKSKQRKRPPLISGYVWD